ncbi:MAG: hypothetical protein V3V57_00730 [Spirochaetia bacterium]
MDTDNLTEMAYQMIQNAEDISEYLRCDIGVRSGKYHDEDDYLKGVLCFLQKIAQHPEKYLESWNIDDIDMHHFKTSVLTLIRHVSETIATPIAERGPTAF